MNNESVQIQIGDDKYPVLLKEIYCPPERLYCRGGVDLLNERLVAVVGSRLMSRRGREHVLRVVKELVGAGVVVVSGLAIGTDTLVHETCLAVGGKTVAVLPTGFGEIYPRRNVGLAERIVVSGGCLVSEYVDDWRVERSNFLRRNRVMAGMCEGVVVTEAERYSGSVSTANSANDEGRWVAGCFCTEGEVNSKGILDLVADGAIWWKGLSHIN